MKDYRKLRVWQKGIEIVKLTYVVTAKLPLNEKDYHRYLEISLGSCFELYTQIEIVIQLELAPIDVCEKLRTNLIEEIMMLQSLMNKLKYN